MPEGHSGGITDARVREIAEAAAESASEKVVTKVFKKLRIRLDDDDSVDNFIDNMRFVAELRENRAQLRREARSTVLDVAKKVGGYLLLMVVVGLGAVLGIHFHPSILPNSGTGPRP